MNQQEIIAQWRRKGAIPDQDMIDQHGADVVWEYVQQCADTIFRRTPNEEDASWDDPEEWQLEAVIVAHGVKLLGELCHCSFMRKLP